MAVTSAEVFRSGISGNATGTDPGDVARTHRITYKFICDDTDDAPKQIYDYCRTHSELPWIGRTFKYGNGTDTDSLCNGVNPMYVDGSAGHWLVDFNFEPLSEAIDQTAGITNEGKESNNPFDWRDEISVGFTQQSYVIERADFMGFYGMPNVNWFLRVGKSYPPCNSALVPYDPGLEEENQIKVIRITKMVPNYDGDKVNPWIGTVNSGHVLINKPLYKFKEQFGPYIGYIKNISAEYDIHDGIKFYRLTTELWLNPFGWRRIVADKGLNRRQAVGDYKPDNTQIDQGDIVPGFAHRSVIKDLDDYPITEPVNFDGNGEPLDPRKDPVWMIWRTKVERNFAGYPWW